MMPLYKKKNKENTDLAERVEANETDIDNLTQKVTENETYINNVNSKLGFLKQVTKISSGSMPYVQFDIKDYSTYLIIVDKQDSTYIGGGAYLLIARGTYLIPLGATAYTKPTIEKSNSTIKLNMGGDTFWYATIYQVS